MIELDRIGITEPMLFPEMDNQAGFVTRRWSVISKERGIVDLPSLNKSCQEADKKLNNTESEFAILTRLYGAELAEKYLGGQGTASAL